MRTLKNFLAILITLTSFFTFSQTDNVWVTINDINRLENNKFFIELKSELGIKVEKAVPASRTESLQKVYQITCNCEIEDLYASLHKVEGITSIEFGPKYETLGTPNDYNLAVAYDYALEKINAQGAWNITEGDSSILISITDAGYRMDNYELYPKVVSANITTSSNPDHGTAVATTAAGYTNNLYGKSSIGFRSSLDLRGMNYNALLEATYAGAKVVNASWAASCFYSQYAQDIINEVYNNGTVIVAAAGNGSTCNGASNLVYPASYNHVISVTSVGPNDNHERFIGNASSTHQHNSMVDISAPGYDVFLTTTNGNFLPGTGTSFAAPYVSGTIALMLSVNPCLNPDEIELILKSSADTSLFEWNLAYQGGLGSGRLNAEKAVEMAKKFSTMDATINENVDCILSEKFLTVSNITGEAPYYFNWSNGDTTEYLVVMNNETYNLTIKDSEGCIFSTDINTEPYNEITINSSVKDVTCFNMTDGLVSLSVSGGTPQYTYELFGDSYYGPLADSIIYDVPAGIYMAMVTDANLCSRDITVIVNQPEQLSSTINTEDMSLDLVVSGGTQPYTYEWYSQNGNYETEDLENMTPGFYEVLITDANGCMVSSNTFLNEPEDDGLGFSEISANEFRVYPNPSNGSVTIESNSEKVIISKISGEIVDTYFLQNGLLELSNLSVGVYIITIDNKIQKLIIQ